MFKYAKLCQRVTFTLDIFFSLLSVALRFLPLGTMASPTLCRSAIPRKIVLSSCVLLFDEGIRNISVLCAEENSWGAPRIWESPEYWTQG